MRASLLLKETTEAFDGVQTHKHFCMSVFLKRWDFLILYFIRELIWQRCAFSISFQYEKPFLVKETTGSLIGLELTTHQYPVRHTKHWTKLPVI